MSTASLLNALIILARQLDALGITYGLIGGAACNALGSPRFTEDIDLVIGVPAHSKMTAEELNNILIKMPGFTGVDADGIGYITPAVDLGGGDQYPVEIFDPDSWPMRPQYQEVFSEHRLVPLPDGTIVKVFSPAWLLREKIQAIYERAGKQKTDLFDIRFLCRIIRPEEYQTGVLDIKRSPKYKEAFNAVLSRLKTNDVQLLHSIFLVE